MSTILRWPSNITHVFPGPVQFQHTQTVLPDGSVTNAKIAALAGIEATKLEGEFSWNYSQTGTVVAGGPLYFGPIRGATGDVISLEAAITETIATGADRTVTIDLQKSTGAGAFATILSSTLVLNNASVLRTAVAAVLAAGAALVAGDILRLTVAVAGAAGNQALGLTIRVILREDAEP